MQPLVADVLLLPINLHDPLSMAESDALGKWLSAFEWTHWVSLSFRYPVTTDTALSVFRKWSSRVMRKPAVIATHTKASWAVAAEAGVGGLVHLHVIAYGPWSTKTLKRAWQSGISKIERYDPEKKGALYLAKVVRDSKGHFDIADDLPPLRKDRSRTVRIPRIDSPMTTQAFSGKVRTISAPHSTRQFATRLDATLFRDLRIAAAEDGTTLTKLSHRAFKLFLHRRASHSMKENRRGAKHG